MAQTPRAYDGKYKFILNEGPSRKLSKDARDHVMQEYYRKRRWRRQQPARAQAMAPVPAVRFPWRSKMPLPRGGKKKGGTEEDKGARGTIAWDGEACFSPLEEESPMSERNEA